MEGINDAFLISVGVVLVALILSFFMKRAKSADEPNDETVKEQNTSVTTTLAEN
jgi:hypothetical protein